jgi:hypothetical protein
VRLTGGDGRRLARNRRRAWFVARTGSGVYVAHVAKSTPRS